MNEPWSKNEKAAATKLFDRAVEVATADYLKRVREYSLATLEDLWSLEKEIRT